MDGDASHLYLPDTLPGYYERYRILYPLNSTFNILIPRPVLWHISSMLSSCGQDGAILVERIGTPMVEVSQTEWLRILEHLKKPNCWRAPYGNDRRFY